jgi:hypothetical protein
MKITSNFIIIKIRVLQSNKLDNYKFWQSRLRLIFDNCGDSSAKMEFLVLIFFGDW